MLCVKLIMATGLYMGPSLVGFDSSNLPKVVGLPRCSTYKTLTRALTQ